MITLFYGEEATPVNVKFWSFPGGERGVKIETDDLPPYTDDNLFVVQVDFRSSNDLIDLLMLNNAIRNAHVCSNPDLVINIPYFPYARQDRVMTSGEALSLKVAVDLIKSCNPTRVVVADPHSDVLAAMFDPGQLVTIPQHDTANIVFNSGLKTYLVSPDAGALKKIYKNAQKFCLPVIEANKVRDVTTGNIVATRVEDLGIDEPIQLVVWDDIIDGGKTFIELAKELKKVYNVSRLVLIATHGIFSKGLDVLDDYDAIYVYNNMSDYDLDAFNNRK